MAVTGGRGNPNWTREEVILALDLYFELEGRIPSRSDPRIQKLSGVLRSFPFHANAARKSSFRNPDGVAFKLQNLRQVATGRGLGNVSKIDRTVWEEFKNSRYELSTAVNVIMKSLTIINEVSESEATYDVFKEGRIVTVAHLKRERDPRIRKKLIEQRKKTGKLECEICLRTYKLKDEDYADAMFEAHHIVPLAQVGNTQTTLKDLALLCACCHRAVHKAITKNLRWLTIDEAKDLIYGEASK